MKSKPSILLIDDDGTTRKIQSGSLALAGFQTYVVPSAQEALAVLEEKPVDLIITDLLMPTYNGVDIIKAVRDCDYTKHIPILVFTAGGSLELIQQAVAAGANEVLQKHTTSPAKLIERIKALTESAADKS